MNLMKRRSLIQIAAGLAFIVLGLGLGATVVYGDEAFERRTQEADRTIALINQLTMSIESMRADAAAHGQAMRASCLDGKLKGARENRSAARAVRSHWDAAQDSVEYRERSMERILRLQVYAMVFEDEARGCASEEMLAKALEIVGPKGGNGFVTTNTTASNDAPPPPHLDRPPLASPF